MCSRICCFSSFHGCLSLFFLFDSFCFTCFAFLICYLFVCFFCRGCVFPMVSEVVFVFCVLVG